MPILLPNQLWHQSREAQKPTIKVTFQIFADITRKNLQLKMTTLINQRNDQTYNWLWLTFKERVWPIGRAAAMFAIIKAPLGKLNTRKIQLAKTSTVTTGKHPIS